MTSTVFAKSGTLKIQIHTQIFIEGGKELTLKARTTMILRVKTVSHHEQQWDTGL